MAIKRILFDIPPEPPRELNFALGIIRALGGTVKKVVQENGLITLISTFPETGPDLEFPEEGSAEFAWMSIARAEIGVKEKSGAADNPRILEYHATCAGGPEPDSVPWCSSFVNFCITRAGLSGTNSKSARSWTSWGRESENFVPGCIVVLWRESPQSDKGHVGFFVGMENGRVRLLGGNQSDEVSIASLEAERVIATRLP